MVGVVQAADNSTTKVDAVEQNSADKKIEVVSIFGQKNQLATATGSAFLIDKAQLDQFEFDDIHRVLQSVPGVYIREEDGYGLRPNIGLRGATTERSSKIAIMEDGVLIAPAPYAAPAAYYFPSVSRMTQVEVFKGPAAILYGPNTVGGAINMVSRPIAEKREGEIDLAYGEDNYQKIHAVFADHIELSNKDDIGISFEGIRLSSDGFKELPNGDNTGFEKNEFIFKANYTPSYSDDKDEKYQFWQLKIGYSEEESNETYLGLTDADFYQNSNQRYLASQKDKMDWEHYQVQLSHYIEIDPTVSLYTQVYHREFDRDWDRFNSFNSNRSMQTILSSPETGLNARFMEVLTGDRDSLTDAETLLFTLNDRRYFSQGIESKLSWESQWGVTETTLDIGLRLHQDQVERHHRVTYYIMQNQKMVLSGQPVEDTTLNKDTATALASYANLKLVHEKLTTTFGVRVEYIEGEASDYLDETEKGNSNHSADTIVLPGIGLFYSLTEQAGFLFGINKGFVPNSPGQANNINPEESWNYELGMRYSNDDIQAEMIGFFNDYSNLKGFCTFANGCEDELDTDFNGGEVNIYGLESSLRTSLMLTKRIEVPVSVAYTYTHTEFQNSFNSTFSQWGNVSAGDELPYLPEHQLSLDVGLKGDNWQIAALFKYVKEMREASGTGTELEGVYTDKITQVDLSAWYQLNDAVRIYSRLDNVTDEAVIVSRRPFGARPGKPQQLMFGIKYNF